jgi:hypothetical protein
VAKQPAGTYIVKICNQIPSKAVSKAESMSCLKDAESKEILGEFKIIEADVTTVKEFAAPIKGMAEQIQTYLREKPQSGGKYYSAKQLESMTSKKWTSNIEKMKNMLKFKQPKGAPPSTEKLQKIQAASETLRYIKLLDNGLTELTKRINPADLQKEVPATIAKIIAGVENTVRTGPHTPAAALLLETGGQESNGALGFVGQAGHCLEDGTKTITHSLQAFEQYTGAGLIPGWSALSGFTHASVRSLASGIQAGTAVVSGETNVKGALQDLSAEAAADYADQNYLGTYGDVGVSTSPQRSPHTPHREAHLSSASMYAHSSFPFMPRQHGVKKGIEEAMKGKGWTESIKAGTVEGAKRMAGLDQVDKAVKAADKATGGQLLSAIDEVW